MRRVDVLLIGCLLFIGASVQLSCSDSPSSKSNVIRVYDSAGKLQIAENGGYTVTPSKTVQWVTASTAFRLSFEGNAQGEVIREDGRPGVPALSNHPPDDAPRTFHISTPEGERVATATLIISQDKLDDSLVDP